MRMMLKISIRILDDTIQENCNDLLRTISKRLELVIRTIEQLEQFCDVEVT
jgi:hypothetical protein